MSDQKKKTFKDRLRGARNWCYENKEVLKVYREQRRKNGERLADILSSMKVLK